MKNDMMIVGLNAVDEETIEVELVPVTSITKKVTIGDLVGGDIADVNRAMQGQKQYRTKIFLPRSWCSSNNLTMFKSMIFDVKPASGVEKDRIHKKVFGE